MKKTVLISLIGAVVFFSGCESKEEQKQNQTQKQVQEVQKEVKQKVEQTSQKVEELAQEAKQKSEQLTETVKQEVQEVQQTIVDESEAPIEKTKEIIKDTAEAVGKPIAADEGKSGKELYVACISCHGQDAKRKALNASEVIANWSQEEIFNALKGYKDGTYGGTMKASMTGQVARLSEEDMKKLAQYISTL